MHIQGPSAKISLEPEQSLRIQRGAGMLMHCVSGVLWVTQARDPHDRFVAAGQSLRLALGGPTLVTALEASVVQIQDPPRAGWLWRRLLGSLASPLPAALILRR